MLVTVDAWLPNRTTAKNVAGGTEILAEKIRHLVADNLDVLVVMYRRKDEPGGVWPREPANINPRNVRVHIGCGSGDSDAVVMDKDTAAILEIGLPDRDYDPNPLKIFNHRILAGVTEIFTCDHTAGKRVLVDFGTNGHVDSVLPMPEAAETVAA